MGAHDFKLNKVPFSALKSVKINVSRSVVPKPDLGSIKLQLLCSKYVIDYNELHQILKVIN